MNSDTKTDFTTVAQMAFYKSRVLLQNNILSFDTKKI